MTVAPLLAAAGGVILLWPRPAVWRRLPARAVDRDRRVVDTMWAAAAAPLVVALLVGAAAGVAIAIATATVMGLRRRAARRADRERRRDELRRGVSVMIAEMSVGAPLSAACASAAEELSRDGPSEVAAELAQMAARVELGGDPADVVVRGDRGVDRLAAAWAASARWGLPMIDLLQMLRSDLSARAEHVARTRAGLAGPRATAMVLAGLPMLGIGLGQLVGAHPLTVLLGPGIGGSF
ncbi:type II secretion system F family protein [Gordonia humi]|uniref:type II secretion system F family protein n=1 Tax=Gordonia humi TaxID=686429 RepID=UPI003621FBD1